jgi:carboxymethylenebutenolidase
MGHWITLKAADGHELAAWRTGPADATRSLVVVQEIFGVNSHMRAVCEDFAAAGYAVVAPALFDRVGPGIELGYDADDVARGRALRGQISDESVMEDIVAAAESLGGAPRGIVGFCWGGTLAWWGATRTRLFDAAVGWYGGGIAATRMEEPSCPVQLHFGEADGGIPMSDVDSIRAAQPDVAVFTYPGAGHGFGCIDLASYSEPDARLAQARTLAFLAEAMA